MSLRARIQDIRLRLTQPGRSEGLTYIGLEPRATREADARSQVRDQLNGDDLIVGSCQWCYWSRLAGHARCEGSHGQWRYRLQEYEAALDELRRAEAHFCTCPHKRLPG